MFQISRVHVLVQTVAPLVVYILVQKVVRMAVQTVALPVARSRVQKVAQKVVLRVQILVRVQTVVHKVHKAAPSVVYMAVLSVVFMMVLPVAHRMVSSRSYVQPHLYTSQSHAQFVLRWKKEQSSVA